jgi:hypothetical protein
MWSGTTAYIRQSACYIQRSITSNLLAVHRTGGGRNQQVLYPDLIVGTIHCHLDRHYETVDEYPSTPDIRSILKYCLMDVVVVVYICMSNYCVNRPLMMILEVDSSSSDVLRTAVGYNVLFTSDTVGWMILGLVLMRPVRLLEGFILAWVLDMWAERVRKKEVDAEAIAREKFHFYI